MSATHKVSVHIASSICVKPSRFSGGKRVGFGHTLGQIPLAPKFWLLQTEQSEIPFRGMKTGAYSAPKKGTYIPKYQLLTYILFTGL